MFNKKERSEISWHCPFNKDPSADVKRAEKFLVGRNAGYRVAAYA